MVVSDQSSWVGGKAHQKHGRKNVEGTECNVDGIPLGHVNLSVTESPAVLEDRCTSPHDLDMNKHLPGQKEGSKRGIDQTIMNQ